MPASASASASVSTSISAAGNAEIVQRASAQNAIENLALSRPASGCDVLSNYALKKTLRRTLQGCVALMTKLDTNQTVAVKVSLKELVSCRRSSAGVRIAEDVVREARLLQRLSTRPCPNIIQLIEHVEDPTRHCLVMEYAEGGELFDYLERVNSISEKQTRSLMASIVSGVKFMHDHSVCHLDLSLENVLLTSDGVPKICDLGLARIFTHGQAFRGSKFTRPGKIAYMAPEVFAGDDFHGDKVDVWSLGIVMFVLLFGFPPFEVASEFDIRFQFARSRGLRALLAEWKLRFHVSEDALDILAAMLSPASTRISIDAILRHKFFQGTSLSNKPAAKVHVAARSLSSGFSSSNSISSGE